MVSDNQDIHQLLHRLNLKQTITNLRYYLSIYKIAAILDDKLFQRHHSLSKFQKMACHFPELTVSSSRKHTLSFEKSFEPYLPTKFIFWAEYN